MCCRRGEDPVIAAIEERIAEWTHLPAENGEGIQVSQLVNGEGIQVDCASDP